MPELLEVESYRLLAASALGCQVRRVTVPDPHCLAPGTEVPALARALGGQELEAARRRGKLLLLDIGEHTLGIHFGMTGTLLLDGVPGVDQLRYAPRRFDPRWSRFRLELDAGAELSLHDPRRLARVALDPVEDRLGPDALGITLRQLREALASWGPGPPLKARLLDQSRIAGVGNLLADEVLYRAGLAPRRPVSSLDDAEVRRLARALRRTLTLLMARGGSHTGDLMAERHPVGHCPRDGTPLRREQVGGRTTLWCPAHQH